MMRPKQFIQKFGSLVFKESTIICFSSSPFLICPDKSLRLCLIEGFGKGFEKRKGKRRL